MERRKQKYCAIVTLDVKNAFNSADWEQILKALTRIAVPSYLFNIIRSYLSGRMLVYDTEEGQKSYVVTSGVPQGSVLGPTLWNIMYDGVLRLEFPTGVNIIGFADDIALVVVAKHKHHIENKGNVAIAIIMDWLKKWAFH